MYKSELDKHIKNHTLSNNLIFFGESHFLIDMYTNMLSKIEDASTLNLYYDEYDFTLAKSHLSQASLFGGNNILIIKSDKKVPKNELEILCSYCAKNQDNLFIYAYYGSDHKSYNNLKAFAKYKTMSVRFFHPKDYEAQNILLHLAQEKKIKISKYTLSHLLTIHHGDLALSANELDKLSIFDQEITNKEIDSVVYGLSEVNIEEFIKKILMKKNFLSDLENLLEHGEDEIRLITTITSYITTLYMFNIYIRTHGTPNAQEILGYNAPKFVVDEKAAMSLRFKPSIYFKLHTLLLETELKMKSAEGDKQSLLFATLIEIQKTL